MVEGGDKITRDRSVPEGVDARLVRMLMLWRYQSHRRRFQKLQLSRRFLLALVWILNGLNLSTEVPESKKQAGKGMIDRFPTRHHSKGQ